MAEEYDYQVTPERLARIRRVLSRRQKDLTLVLANIHDPHNVSAIFRSCDAFAVPRVHLYYTDTAFPALGKKSSASARKWVQSLRHDDAQTMAGQIRESLGPDCQILATGFSDQARPVVDYDLTRPTAVMLGNEHRGVDPELVALADGEAYIPMQGMVQSLNVSVAAAVTLFEAWRQRRAKGMFKHPSFPEEELEALIRQWCKR